MVLILGLFKSMQTYQPPAVSQGWGEGVGSTVVTLNLSQLPSVKKTGELLLAALIIKKNKHKNNLD